MSVRAVALASTPGVIGRHELCMGGKQVVESAQHEGAAFELELAHVCNCCTSVWAVGSDGPFKQAVLSSDVLFKQAVLSSDVLFKQAVLGSDARF